MLPSELGQLPATTTTVPNYEWDGSETPITPNWFPGSNPTIRFYGLSQVDGVTEFDPTIMTPSETQLATDPAQGALIGFIAAPFGMFKKATDNEQSKLFTIINGSKYSLSPMFDNFHGSLTDYVVYGVYTGNPDVTSL